MRWTESCAAIAFACLAACGASEGGTSDLAAPDPIDAALRGDSGVSMTDLSKTNADAGAELDLAHGAFDLAGVAPNVTCACNGTTDDSACLQALIDKSSAIVFTASQTCVASTQLTIGAGKVLYGNGASIKAHFPLSFTGNGSVLDGFTLTGFNSPVVSIGAVDGLTISNNVINGNGANTGTDNQNSGIGIESIAPNTKNVTLSGNTIKNSSYGILVSATHFGTTQSAYQSGFSITDNTVTGVGGDAIEINSPTNCTYFGSGSHGISKNGSGQQECDEGSGVIGTGSSYGSGVQGVAMTNFTIAHNTLDAAGSTTSGWGFCLGIAGLTSSRVLDNQMQRCKWQCIHIEDAATGLTVSGNQCGTPTVAGTIGSVGGESSAWAVEDSAGIFVQNRANGIALLQNTIHGARGYGIELADNPNAQVTYLGDATVYMGDEAFDISAAANVIASSGDAAIYAHATYGSTIGPLTFDSVSYGGNQTSSSWTTSAGSMPQSFASANASEPDNQGAIMYATPAPSTLVIKGNSGN